MRRGTLPQHPLAGKCARLQQEGCTDLFGSHGHLALATRPWRNRSELEMEDPQGSSTILLAPRVA